MLIFSNKAGQLGNRLFAFAHLIAAAKKHDLKVINLSFDEYAQYFSTTAADTLCRYPAQVSSIRSEKLRSFLFLWNRVILKMLRKFKMNHSPLHAIVVADLPEYDFKDTRSFDLADETFLATAKAKPVVFLFGRFFRDYKDLVACKEEIRSFFSPIPSIQHNIRNCISNARQGCDTLIGVHIRRGDYAVFVDGKYFYSQSQYCTLMTQLGKRTLGMKIRFLICSNEAIDLTLFDGLDVVKAPGHLVEDLYCLSHCDYIMGPPSTFTKWASFYGSKPLYHIKSIDDPISIERFVMQPPEILFNFSFN